MRIKQTTAEYVKRIMVTGTRICNLGIKEGSVIDGLQCQRVCREEKTTTSAATFMMRAGILDKVPGGYKVKAPMTLAAAKACVAMIRQASTDSKARKKKRRLEESAPNPEPPISGPGDDIDTKELIEDAIKLLKANGYRILAPVVTHEEV